MPHRWTRLKQCGKVKVKLCMCMSRRHVGEWPFILGVGNRQVEFAALSLYLSGKNPLYELKRAWLSPKAELKDLEKRWCTSPCRGSNDSFLDVCPIAWSLYWLSCPDSSSPERLALTFWSRNYFLKFSTPVYKVWIIQGPNKLELWNKLHFVEDKTESIYHV